MFAKFITIALCLVAASMAWGSDTAGKFAVRGIGAQPCRVWIELADTKDEVARRDSILAFQSWLAGYLSATNRLQPQAYDVVPFLDMVNILAITLNECRRTPDALAENTVARVIGAFSKVIVDEESPIIMVPDAGAQKPYRQSTLYLLQQKLVDLGYLDSVPDGVIGPATTQAVRLYQSENGLAQTGELSVDTIFQLLLK